MISQYFDWAYSGVNVSIPSSGGPDCVKFLSDERKIAETLFAIALSLFQIAYSWREVSSSRIVFPKKSDTSTTTSIFNCNNNYDGKIINNNNENDSDGGGKGIFLALFCFIFGIEVGFKLSTRQLIWLLNPCHMVTIAQIYLLSVTPSKTSLIIFRIHLYYLIGPIIALIVPVVNSRKLLFEKHVYFIQHILIVMAPYYITKNKVYNVEDRRNMKWPMMAQGIVFLFHFTVLQALSIMTQVNLDNIICPASSDPFSGPWYRMAALLHQPILITATGKLYPIVLQKISNLNFREPMKTFVFDGNGRSVEGSVKLTKNKLENEKNASSYKNGIKQS